jgi:hypothetical protein
MSASHPHIFRTRYGSEKPAPRSLAVSGGMSAHLLNSFNSRIGIVLAVVIPQVSITVL